MSLYACDGIWRAPAEAQTNNRSAGYMSAYARMPAIMSGMGAHGVGDMDEMPRLARTVICHFPLSTLGGLGFSEGMVQ